MKRRKSGRTVCAPTGERRGMPGRKGGTDGGSSGMPPHTGRKAGRKGSVLVSRMDGTRVYLRVGCEVLADIPAIGAQGQFSLYDVRRRKATIVYIHPERRFLVVEVEGAPIFGDQNGKRACVRYGVWPEQVHVKNRK